MENSGGSSGVSGGGVCGVLGAAVSATQVLLKSLNRALIEP